MTYLQRQEASGIKVGDTVRVVKTAEQNERGWKNSWCPSDMKVGQEGVVTKMHSSGCDVDTGRRYSHLAYPYFVLEVISSQCGEDGPREEKPIKDEAMKTQDIFAVVVTENEKTKDDNGNIDSIKKRVIYSAIDIPAFDENNAKAKALLAANKVAGVKGIKDLDEVEVKVSPFPG